MLGIVHVGSCGLSCLILRQRWWHITRMPPQHCFIYLRIEITIRKQLSVEEPHLRLLGNLKKLGVISEMQYSQSPVVRLRYLSCSHHININK